MSIKNEDLQKEVEGLQKQECHETQFQIESGGMVQGVTKLIMTFSTLFNLTN